MGQTSPAGFVSLSEVWTRDEAVTDVGRRLEDACVAESMDALFGGGVAAMEECGQAGYGDHLPVALVGHITT